MRLAIALGYDPFFCGAAVPPQAPSQKKIIFGI
jgi:hypothetical protein